MYARRRGMGDSIPTCYYYVTDPSTGLPVCGSIGRSPALLPNAGLNPSYDADYAQITIQEIAGWVGYYASLAMALHGGSPGQQESARQCAVAAFNGAVTAQDVISGNAGKINSAANAAVRSAYQGACNPQGVASSWVPSIASEAAALVSGKYPPFVLCDDRSSSGAHDCLAVSQIVQSGNFDFASLAAGGATAGGSSASIMDPVLMNATQPATSIQYIPMPLQPLQVQPAQQVFTPLPPVSSALSVPGGGPVYTQQAVNQYYPQAQQSAAVQSQTTAGAGSSLTNSVSGALSSLETSASGAASTGLNWIESNPLLAAGIAAAVLFLFMGGRK